MSAGSLLPIKAVLALALDYFVVLPRLYHQADKLGRQHLKFFLKKFATNEGQSRTLNAILNSIFLALLLTTVITSGVLSSASDCPADSTSNLGLNGGPPNPPCSLLWRFKLVRPALASHISSSSFHSKSTKKLSDC